MVANLTYRTNDATRWGTGAGADLAAVTIDLNFWILWSALSSVQSSIPAAGRSIDYIALTGGNSLMIHLTDHSVQGPFVVPSEIWNPRGNWAATTVYAPLDVISENGSLYLVNVAHTSGSTFNALANDGLGHNLYTLLLAQPADTLPTSGVIGQKLVYTGGSPAFAAWENEYVRLALFVPGQPSAGTTLLQYCVTDHMQLPIGLLGSVAYSAVPSLTTQSYPIFQNGNPIGAIIFNGSGSSPSDVDVAFTTVINLSPGDILTINAPAAPDVNQANISITLLATLTT